MTVAPGFARRGWGTVRSFPDDVPTAMLGQATASLERPPRRLLQRWFGTFDINARQKWRAVWPSLSTLPLNHLRLLDAGCGSGSWSLELAARRGAWTIVGLDRDRQSIEIAEANRRKLGLENVSFLEADFLSFQPPQPFDAILSVASAHYLVEAGFGSALFEKFSAWLKQDGLLVLFGPRRGPEMPTARALPALPARDIFGRQDLDSLCREGGLTPQAIRAVVGRFGTLAKQVSRIGDRSAVIRTSTYPFQLILDSLDPRTSASTDRRSTAWLVTARKKGA